MKRVLVLGFPYLLTLALVVFAWVATPREDPGVASKAPGVEAMESARIEDARRDGTRLPLDPVCSMEVNPAWGYRWEHQGRLYFFCSRMCLQRFASQPDRVLRVKCMVCRTPLPPRGGLPVTYLGKAYRVCSAEHRREFKEDPAAYFMHRMWGIPEWLYYVSIALILLVSFGAFEKVSGREGGGRSADSPRLDLMRWRVLRVPLRSRVFRFAAQLVVTVFFLVIVAAGLFGNQNPALNIAPLLTWTIWWCGLVVLIMFAGKAWCYVCPWDALATWAERLRLWKKTGEGLGLSLPWPRALRNVWLATTLLVGLTWIELGFGVTMKPWATACLALAMVLLAFMSAFLFDKKAFCRYGCLVGRVSGLYAMFSGVEVRSRDASVCRSCRTKECVKGSGTAYGCPTSVYPGGLEVNTYCIQCTECLQSCSKDNMTVLARPWGEDLGAEGKPRRDEAYLALLMLAISGFHGLTMTPVWIDLTTALQRRLPFSETVAFSLGMAILLVLPVLAYAVLVQLSYMLVGWVDAEETRRTSFGDYFVRYAYCVLPIALFYHLAHNMEHLLMEGPRVLALVSDPFGWGWDLFGTAGWAVPPLVNLEVLWIIQVVLVGVGHIYSLWAASRISRRLFRNPKAASRGQWPLLLGMILFSVFSLWLLKQPMQMRSSVM